MGRGLKFALLVSAAIHGIVVLAWYRPEEPARRQPLLAASLRAPLPVSAPGAVSIPAPSPRRQPPGQARPAAARAVAAPSPQAAALDHIEGGGAPAPSRNAAAAIADPLPVASAPTPAVDPPRFDAAYLANPPPDYPRPAKRRGSEGTVLLDARISPAGEAREIKLAASAGDILLDEAAVAAVRGWRFVPARRGQEAIEAWVRIPVVFRLN